MSEDLQIPEKWKQIPIADLIDKGFRPRVKTVRGTEYMTLRFKDEERSLGPHTEKKWDLLMEMFPQLRVPEVTASPTSSILTTKLSKPKSVKKSFTPTIDTLKYYEWARAKGFDGQLDDFVNEVVADHFAEKNIKVPVVIVRGE